MVRKITTLFAGVLMILVMSCSAYAQAADVFSDYKHPEYFITPEQLNLTLNDKNLVLLDCNNVKVYKKGHIPGAVNIGYLFMSTTVGHPGDPGWGTALPIKDLREKLFSLGITDDSTVVLYSDVFKGPGADGRNFWQLKMAGMENVKLLAGGLTSYRKRGYSLEKKPSFPVPAKGKLSLREYDSQWYITREAVFNSMGKEPILDTRTKKEFKGSTNAGEPRGGHIAGAKWILWQDILDKDGYPKPAQEIKDIMKKRFALTPEDSFTVY